MSFMPIRRIPPTAHTASGLPSGRARYAAAAAAVLTVLVPCEARAATPPSLPGPGAVRGARDCANEEWPWACLAECESGGRWHANTGNGYYGGLQFDRQTWVAYDGDQYAPLPHQAGRDAQIAVASRVRDERGGYGSWPACARKLGLPT